VSDLIVEAGKTRIQAVEFGIGTGMNGSEPLQRLSGATRGSYRYVDLKKVEGDGR
jgi:hypothetical protein